MKSRDLILVTSQLVQADLGDQVPKDNVGIFGAAGEPDARLVKGEFRDGGFVTIEVDYDGGNLAVPESDAAVIVADGKDILVGLALGNYRDGDGAALVSPSAQKLSLLDVPAQDLFVCGDDRLSRARACSILGRPDDVGGASRDNAK